MLTTSAIFCLLSLLLCFSSGQDISLPKCSSENSYSGVIGDLRKSFVEMKRELNIIQETLGTKIVQLENKLRPKEIAFTATIDENSTFTNIKMDQTIKFRLVYYNVGNGYDRETGIFNCPVPGTYVFFVSIMSKPNIKVAVHITVNGVTKMANVFGGAIPGVPVGTGNMAVVKLKKNDKVWVKSHLPQTSELDPIFRENSFSGFLLYQD